jgi:hypothetical protein
MSIDSFVGQILSFWECKMFAAPSEKRIILQERNLNAFSEMNVTPIITPQRQTYFAKCGNYTVRIGERWIDCDCHSFLCSAKGHANKQPCKHLYALACWVQTVRALEKTQ